MKRAQSERGSALMMAIILMFIALGIGAALMATAVGQKREASNQQQTESAYSLAEAALNAQIFQLTQQWPTSFDPPSGNVSNYPSSCNAATNGFSYCPSTTDLSASYPTTPGTCPANTQHDAWSSSSTVTNGWTTYVRDTGGPGSATDSLFSSSSEEGMAPYDSSYNPPTTAGSVWVRAVGIVNCRMAVVVSKVSAQIVGVDLPKYVLNANSFTISDSGQKDVLNTQDPSGNPTSQISLRCVGEGGLPPNSTCAGVQNSQQIAPTTSYSSSPAPNPTLSATQLATLKELAIANGTYFPVGGCPTSASQLAGQVVYIDGTNASPCNLQFTSNSIINSAQLPGVVVLVNGTLQFGGSATFYGVIYAVNQGNLSGNVVYLGGTTTVVGGIAVDGSGTVALNLGSSGNGQNPCTDTGSGNKCGDLQFLAKAFTGLSGFAGADPTPNTFRQLPNSQ